MESERIVVIKKRRSYSEQVDDFSKYTVLDVTSNHPNERVSHSLSPLWLHDITAPDGEFCYRFENLWQYTKVYKEFTDKNGNPTDEYWKWRSEAFVRTDKGVRYPFDKARRPEYAYWMINGEWHKLGYLDARKIIYIPEYAKLVTKTDFYKELKEYYDTHSNVNLALADYDAYNNYKFDMSLVDVYNDYRKAGHAFVLKMLLEGDIEVVDGKVIDNIGVLKTNLYEQQSLF